MENKNKNCCGLLMFLCNKHLLRQETMVAIGAKEISTMLAVNVNVKVLVNCFYTETQNYLEIV